jgi:hypothetical protein
MPKWSAVAGMDDDGDEEEERLRYWEVASGTGVGTAGSVPSGSVWSLMTSMEVMYFWT